MSKLTVIANIIAKADQIDFVKAEIEKIIATTRTEDGCLQYDLHQDNKNPARFVMIENWESPDHLKAHLNQPHLQGFVQATKDALENFTVEELTQIA